MKQINICFCKVSNLTNEGEMSEGVTGVELRICVV